MPKCKICKRKFARTGNSIISVCEAPACRSEYTRSKSKKGQRAKIAPISDKRKKQMDVYSALRKTFLEGKRCPVTGKPATEVHHTNNREHDRLNDMKYWLAVSREGHEWIHAHPKEAREAGWLV